MKKRVKDRAFFCRRIINLLRKSQPKDETLAGRAVEVFGPFCQIAAKGQYLLAKPSSVLNREAKKALTLAFGKPVKRVIFLSARKPTPRYFRGQLKPDYLEDQLFDLFHEQLRRGLSQETEASLWYGLSDGLIEPLGQGFKRRHGVKGTIGALLADSLREVLEQGLFAYLGLVVLGNKEEAEKLEPLIQLLAKAIPIAQKRKKPATWFVLVR